MIGNWSLPFPYGWRVHADGTLIIPPSVKTVIIDVGVCFQSQFQRQLDQDDSLLIIGFEPLHAHLGNWMPKKLKVVHPRLVMIPAAVSHLAAAEHGGRRTLPFNFFLPNLHTPLSSLYELAPGMKERMLKLGGKLGVEKISVHAVTLEEILQRLPPHLTVSLLKIDAQGADLSVVLSAGSHLGRIKRIQLECQDLPIGHEDLVYAGMPTKGEIVDELRRRHFMLERCWDNTPWSKEQNCMFAQAGTALENLKESCFMDALRTLEKKPRLWRLLQLTSRTMVDDEGMYVALYDTPARDSRGARLRDRTRDYNYAVVAESLCCTTSLVPQAQCFNATAGRTKETCCLNYFLEQIGYDKEAGQSWVVELSWTPGVQQAHWIWPDILRPNGLSGI